MRVPKVPSKLDFKPFRRLHEEMRDLLKVDEKLLREAQMLDELRGDHSKEWDSIRARSAENERAKNELRKLLRDADREASRELLDPLIGKFLRELQGQAMRKLLEVAEFAETMAAFRADVSNEGYSLHEALGNHLDMLRRDVPGSVTDRFIRNYEQLFPKDDDGK